MVKVMESHGISKAQQSKLNPVLSCLQFCNGHLLIHSFNHMSNNLIHVRACISYVFNFQEIEGAVSWEINGRYHGFWPKFTKFKL